MNSFVSTFAVMLLPGLALAAETAATIANPVKEADLTTVVLKPEAEKRLGIKLAPVERRSMPRMRLVPGEVVRPLASGSAASVAPVVGGTLDEVLKLADAQADANGRVSQAEVQLDAAKVTFDRAQKMLTAEAGSARAVDEAKAQVALAEAALKTAQERRALLGEAMGQVTAATKLWVRVPVYAGQLSELELDKNAEVSAAARSTQSNSRATARPVTGPPTANAAAATVDVFYELEAPLAGARPGARVEVNVPAKGEAESLVVPWAAVLHDINGGQWIYEQTAPYTFARRRIMVDRVAGGIAVLASGPKAGAQIVTDGAAELFGTEFGVGK
ncbi:hypothetical protein AYO49_01635 [Verrucomicrobiaceae bacterium SCGC AG-212-N21]|nr:hypothetical protein AYO49_01635 [Verrucomicrobiaceae bacterium SCGC AG-212-N21]